MLKFQITDDEKEKQLTVRTLREKKMQALLKNLSSVQVVAKSFTSLPAADAHKVSHVHVCQQYNVRGSKSA